WDWAVSPLGASVRVVTASPRSASRPAGDGVLWALGLGLGAWGLGALFPASVVPCQLGKGNLGSRMVELDPNFHFPREGMEDCNGIATQRLFRAAVTGEYLLYYRTELHECETGRRGMGKDGRLG